MNHIYSCLALAAAHLLLIDSVFAKASEADSRPARPRDGKVVYQTLSLNGVWSVTPMPLPAAGEDGYRALIKTNSESFRAQVPGEIHLDLMRAGRMEDPDVSDNARERCRWPEQYSWWYRT